ncbi:MAG: OmpA family protein [Chitinophagaceae bacterium]|nr:MAG: OmpA family protein [Chitinophagaceae bacterium]
MTTTFQRLRLPSATWTGLFILLFCLYASGSASAQFNVKEKLKEKASQRAETHVDNGIDKSLDAVESLGKKKKKTKTESATAPAPEAAATPATPAPAGRGAISDSSAPTLTSYSKFDFVPGEKVVFYEDFSRGAIGDFPVNWNTGGTGEMVTINGIPGRWLKWSAGVGYAPVLKEPFPENFTLEFDILLTQEGEKPGSYFGINLYSGSKDDFENTEGIGNAGVLLFTQGEWEIYKWSEPATGERVGGSSQVHISSLYNKVAHVSIWGQKQRIRVYLDEKKILDLPQGLPAARLNRVKFSNNPGINAANDDQSPVYLTNVRIATGLPDMRSKLLTEGKLVTRGILFDVNSDRIKGESYGTLKEIAQVLIENPGIKVKVVGHTDSDGTDAANLELSRRRAAAVRAALKADFGVDVSNMLTDGKGATVPVSPNTTPEGKANNRRVEFIKL